jgi:hypothetical protein
MQARLQGDLRDLQTRHQTALASKAEYEELLQQLTPRLREASQQLQALSLMEAPEQSPALPATPGKRRKKAGA